jgi:hypothetical protein
MTNRHSAQAGIGNGIPDQTDVGDELIGGSTGA